jgi:hypothetical protein
MIHSVITFIADVYKPDKGSLEKNFVVDAFDSE